VVKEDLLVTFLTQSKGGNPGHPNVILTYSYRYSMVALMTWVISGIQPGVEKQLGKSDELKDFGVCNSFLACKAAFEKTFLPTPGMNNPNIPLWSSDS